MTAARPLLPGRLLVVADSSAASGRPLLDVLAAAVSGGASSVWLREHHLPRQERLALAGKLWELLEPVGGTLIAGGSATVTCASGTHLRASDPMPSRRPALLGRSCHSRAEVVAAAEEGCDYVTLSPVFATGSKPGYGPALGLGALGGLPLPVWALGGAGAANAPACLAAGATGVAVMGEVMGAPDPAAASAAILAGIGSVAA